jgi:tetraacyldisaccharide 4'-kinase
MTLEAQLTRRWYGRPLWLWLLWPLEWLYRAVVAARRSAYRRGWLASWRAPVPVLVVGNIAVGGTGKTPVVIALCQALRSAGWRPGIISRGYGAQPPQFPYAVDVAASAAEAGDEPLLLARRSGCPVVIAPDRAAAARELLRLHACDIVICDDGLQHYALARDIELAVIDGGRGLGNRHCLPVGPLREPPARLATVDAILINGDAGDPASRRREHGAREHRFFLQPTALVQLAGGQRVAVADWPEQRRRVHAVAGIGNPDRFFTTLRGLGFQVAAHPKPDHHRFVAADFQFDAELPIVMTEKDAVKCVDLDDPRLWYLAVDAVLPDSLLAAIAVKLAPFRRSV